MNDVTHLLSAIEQGDAGASEQLLPLVYDELRKLAAQKLAQEKPGETLQAPANFGAYSNDLLIGNVAGAGNINVFDTTGN
jgi:hypothetical protein